MAKRWRMVPAVPRIVIRGHGLAQPTEHGATPIRRGDGPWRWLRSGRWGPVLGRLPVLPDRAAGIRHRGLTPQFGPVLTGLMKIRTGGRTQLVLLSQRGTGPG